MIGLRLIGFRNPDLPSLPRPPAAAISTRPGRRPRRHADPWSPGRRRDEPGGSRAAHRAPDASAPGRGAERLVPRRSSWARRSAHRGRDDPALADDRVRARPSGGPGRARDGWWSGDTLLVAASLGLERFTVSPAPSAGGTLEARLDPGSRAAARRGHLAARGVARRRRARPLSRCRRRQRPGADGRESEPRPPAAGRGFGGGRFAAGRRSGSACATGSEAFFADGSSIQVAEEPLRALGAARDRAYRIPSGRGTAPRQPSRTGAREAGATLTLRVIDVASRLWEIRTVPRCLLRARSSHVGRQGPRRPSIAERHLLSPAERGRSGRCPGRHPDSLAP